MNRRRLLELAGLGALAATTAGLTSCSRHGGSDAGAPHPRLDASVGATPSEPREAAVPDVPEDRRTADHPSPSSAAAADLAVVCRDDWGARPPGGGYVGHEPRLLTIHHTAVLARDGEGAARVRSHQRHHLDSGFVDLAYHHIVSRDGTVYEGRPVTAAGETFTDYEPAGHYLPCLEGDFGRQLPTDAQLDALVGLLAWASSTYGIPTSTLAGHREYAATACPGDALQRLVADGSLRRAVDDLTERGGVRLVHTCA